MAKNSYKKYDSAKLVQVNTPSPYGSHASMVVEEVDETFVICEDGYGKYQTRRDRLDNGLADPSRCNGNRVL